MNKKFTCLLTGLLLLCGIGSTAQVTFNISPENISANVDDVVSVDVTVANFATVMSMQFAIGWNENVLEFQSISNLNGDLPGLSESNVGTPGQGNVAANRIFFSWNHPSFINTQLSDGSVLFTINFVAKAGGETTFSFVDDAPGIEIIDSNGQDQGFSSDVLSTVTIAGGSGGGGGGGGGGGTNDCTFDGFGLLLSEVSGAQGEEITVDVSVQDFQAISGMQFTIDFDASILEFVEVTNVNLTGLSGAGNFSTAGLDPGKIILTWNDPQGTGITHTDGTVIFSLTFKVLQETETVVALSDDPRQIEFLQEDNGNSQLVDFTICDATINEGASGGGGGGGGGNADCTFDGFGLKFADVDGAQGTEICIDVTVQDFIDILGMQYTINYDPAVLEFKSVANTNLAGLTAGGNFGNPSPGKITVFWFDQAVSGVTLADDTRIYTICFTVLQDSPTTITLGDSPTAIEFTDTSNSGVLDYTICGGSVNGGGGGGVEDCTLEGFGLDIGNVTGAKGDKVCVDFAVQDFDLITGMQFTLNFDNSILEYAGVENIDLPDLSAGGNFGNPAAGKITVFWFHQATTGVTKADGTVIFSICFNVLKTTGTTLTLSDSPTAIEFSKFGATTGIAYDICPGTVNMVTSSPPVISNATVTPTSCNNTQDGSVTLTVDGGGSYTYQWSRGSSTTNSITGLASGAISVTVTDTESGLTTTGDYNITSPSAITVNANIVQVSCVGEGNGSIVITASGGTGNLKYSWMPGGSTNSSLNNLAPGSYGLTITDANNCTTPFGPYQITEPSADIAVTETITDVTCAADETGSIAVQVSGGTPTYRLDWSGSLLDNVQTQTGLKAGNYGLTVTDSRNCTQTFQFTVASTNPAIQISAVPVNIPDGGEGAVNITATGGTGNFNYSWTGPSGFSATTEDLTGLTTAGEYCVTVTDAAGCTEDICVTLGQELVISNFSLTQPCDGGSNGAIKLTIKGGVKPYTFNWQKVGTPEFTATTRDIEGIQAGTYNVTVTDANNTNVTGSFELTGTSLEIGSTITPSAPGASSGSITLSIPGSAGNYTVSWDNGATTANISNLAIGKYCVTITFDGGCVFEDCYQVTDEPFSIVSLETTDAGCVGNNDGSLSLQVKGGVRPYSLKVGGSTYTSNNGIFNIDALAAGTFQLMVSDAGGASESREITIGASSSITYEAIVVHDTEDSGCTGSITLQISGGKAPYNVTWNGQGLVGQQVIVCGFDYIAMITDSKGCMITTDVISVNTFSESAVITDVTCPGEENAAIDLTITGGKKPYSFAWREVQGGQIISNKEDLSDIGEGTYYVEITEASGNKLNRSYTVETASGLTVLATVESDHNGSGVSCVDASDGELLATVSKASGMVEYEWLLGGSVVGTERRLRNAAAGDYILRVVDDNCISEIPVTLPAPDPLGVEALNIKDAACEGERDGAIVVAATGGTPPYIYRWSNNDFGNEIDFLAAGSYTVTVTDRNNCMTVNSFNVSQPKPLEVTVVTEPASNELGSDCNGSVRAMVTGGKEPYSYRWININNSRENMVTGLCPGEYIVEVTDALGCFPVEGSGIVYDRTQPCFSTRTVITPDGDGLNESFIIFCADEYPDNLLKIYNRWGELVYQKQNYDCTQNGGECFKGRRGEDQDAAAEALPEGAYYWILEYRDNATGEDVILKGSLTILEAN
ncbi:MAG: cohesin domain-containing protein [Saprospiraceae bacterium]